jgi:integrase
MPRKTTPKYRLHKARNCAVITIAGRDHYLGAYDSAESWEKYHRLVAEHLAGRREPPPPVPDGAPLTVTELIARYWRFANGYYVKDGRPTSETHAIKLALRFLRRLYGNTAACEFSPKKLKAVREAMIAHEITRKVKVTDEETGTVTVTRKVVRKGMARRCINKLVGRLKRLFAWGVEEELVPVAVHASLARVKGLKKGKSAARETARVRPVLEEHVQKVLAVVSPAVRAMIEVQRLTGCRPQDVVQMRSCEIDTTGSVWEHRPRRFKTEHYNDDGTPDLDRVVYIGPKAQAVLKPLIPEIGTSTRAFPPGRTSGPSPRSTSPDGPAGTTRAMAAPPTDPASPAGDHRRSRARSSRPSRTANEGPHPGGHSGSPDASLVPRGSAVGRPPPGSPAGEFETDVVARQRPGQGHGQGDRERPPGVARDPDHAGRADATQDCEPVQLFPRAHNYLPPISVS